MEKQLSVFNIFTFCQWTFIVIVTVIIFPQVQSQQLLLVEAPDNITGQIGQPVTLKCIFNRPVMCTWLRNTVPVKVSDDYSFVSGIKIGDEHVDCSFKISKLTEVDFAQWKCAPYGELAAAEIYITKQVPPSVPVIMFNQNELKELKLPTMEKAGDLVCISSNGNPAAELHWIINGTRYNGTLRTVSAGPQNHTTLLNFTYDWRLLDHVQQLRCQANHPAYHRPREARLKLKHNHAPRRVHVWIGGVEGNEIGLGEGASAQLLCISDGQPTPSFVWEELPKGDNTWKLLNSSLNDQNITIVNEGQYRCSASNELNMYTPTVSANSINIYRKSECNRRRANQKHLLSTSLQLSIFFETAVI